MNLHLSELEKIPDIHAKALHYVFENNLISDDGLWLEFGVYAGGTICRMAKYTNKPIIYGFDSFEGLPEAWVGRTDFICDAGAFNLSGNIPSVPSHVTLIKGWFDVTILEFTRLHPNPISLLHIDSDIYSSAKQIFDGLKYQISNGCIVVFDELIGYPGFEQHEWKAWWEFVDDCGIEFEWIGGNPSKSVPQNQIRHPNSTQVLFDSDRRDYSPANNISPPWENVALRIRRNPLFEERNNS